MYQVGLYDSNPFQDIVDDNIEPILRAELLRVIQECGDTEIEFVLSSIPFIAKNNKANISFIANKILSELKDEFLDVELIIFERKYYMKPLELVRDCDLILAYYYKGICSTENVARKLLDNIMKQRPDANIQRIYNPMVQLAINNYVDTRLSDEQKEVVSLRCQGISLKRISEMTGLSYSRVNRIEKQTEEEIIFALKKEAIVK